MDTFHLRMLLAARKQILRDMADKMNQDQIDKILEQIGLLIKLIEQLENKK